jgi:3-phenylpropionate/trans-cinnamate dioxygenase ferredoxin subunit
LAKHRVAKVGEIPPGGRKIIEVAGRSIGVFNISGEFFALRNQCPHAGGPLCEGILSGFLRSDAPGEYDYVRRGEILRCPWHQWEFDVRTGQSWFDPVKTRVRRYEASIEPSSADEEEITAAGLEKGPYTAETYDVSLEEQYVVLEM